MLRTVTDGNGLGQMLSQATRDRLVETSQLLTEATALWRGTAMESEVGRLWRQYNQADFHLSKWGESDLGSPESLRLLRNVNIEARNLVSKGRTERTLQRTEAQRQTGPIPELDWTTTSLGWEKWALPVGAGVLILLLLRR